MFPVAAYSFAHFAVDLGCAYSYFSHCDTGSLGFLIYNYCAFALQMPLGLLADRIGRGKWFAAGGCLITALMCLMPGFGMPGAAVLGIGNALFHIGGGVEILYRSNRAAPLGIFVSPGALGLFWGTLLGKANYTPLLAFAVLAVSFSAILLLREGFPGDTPNVRDAVRAELLPVILLFAVVVLRSFAGMAGSFPWKQGAYSLAAVLCVAAGKTLGGIAADHFGMRIAGAASLSAAAVCFLFSQQALPGLAALLLFNMSMPVTLHALALRMPRCKGFSFGMLTFALFLGFVPIYLGAGSVSAAILAVCAVVSALLLLPALRKRG